MSLFHLGVLLLIVLPLIRADSSTITTKQISLVVQPPPPQWTTGEPYTTLPLYVSEGAATPTWSVVTTTTSLQVLPTRDVYVATGLPVSPVPATPTYLANNRSHILDGVPGYISSPLKERDVERSTAFTIDLTTVTFTARCWYPVSGNYGKLPRVLFYFTIAAAVVLRTHLPWLYLGALAASLTYSGSAAIHACLLIWRGPAWGELDMFALLAILSVSCLTMVPLLNWSSTIRTAGRPDLQSRENDERPKVIKEIDASARIILIFWSFLVTVGFLCAFIGFQDRTPGSKLGHWSPIVTSGQQSIFCAPPGGILNVTAGQIQPYEQNGLMLFNGFFISREFIEANNCQNPCSNPVGGVALFRSDGDLAVVGTQDLLVYLVYHTTTKAGHRKWSFILDYSTTWSFVIIYILLQGVWTVCFGRSKPSHIRTILYGYFSRIHVSGLDPNRYGQRRHRRRYMAQLIALGAYSWALFIVLIAIPFLIVNVTVIEVYMRGLPESETAQHIGAWTPYASTGLVLVGVALAKTYDTIKALVLQTSKNVWRIPQIIWHSLFSDSRTNKSQNQPKIEHSSYVEAFNKASLLVKATGEFIFGNRFRERAVREWHDLLFFIQHPDEDWERYDRKYGPGATDISPVCECPEDFTCKAHPGCSHSRRCKDDSKCKDCKVCDGKLHYLNHECICTSDTVHFSGIPALTADNGPKSPEVQVSAVTPSSADSGTQGAVAGGVAGGGEMLPLQNLNARQNSLPQMSMANTMPQQGLPVRSSTTPVQPQRSQTQQEDSTRRLLGDNMA